ncbi:MAG TPA: response regulator [Gemmatimonadales bacterium]|jgi:PAS domain S-box-containing protein|nr:response regulator [Gemmatimonadales bacterium]
MAEQLTSRTYARALRIVAAAIAVVAVAKHLAGDFPDPAAQRDLLDVRGAAALLALLIAGLSSPSRSVAQLQRLAFALGIDVVLLCLGAVVVVPAHLWEQSVSLVGMMFGAAVFLPWSWRWQVALVGVTLLAATATILLLADGELAGHVGARALVTLYGMGALSVVGGNLAERARRYLAASEARYRGLFETATDGIALLDENGFIREANPRLADLLGRPMAELIGTRLRDFYADPAETDALRSAAHIIRRPDGRSMEVEIEFSPVPNPEGEGSLIQADMRDRTERRTEERRHIQAQRLDSMARLSGALAHQYNNILGGILTHAAVLREEVPNPDARAAADEVLKAARRGRELTQELLGLSRPETVALKPASAVQFVESTAALARAAVPAGVEVKTDVAPSLPPIFADVDQLVHACLELVFNARDAMRGRPNSLLTFKAVEEKVASGNQEWPGAPPGRYVRISVTDTGRGMDPAVAERVFEPFFTTKPLHQAKGLGLAEVQRVLQEHRGAVRIETVIGKGTTVHLLLPIAPETAPVVPSPERTAPAAAAPTGPLAPKGATILIVDDEEIVRNSLRRALTRFGYKVLDAGDGTSALAAMQAADPPVDLVILDLVLPGGGAGVFELLKAIRPEVRVLISSGYSPDAEAARGLAERVEGFLPKPYELSQLRTAVANALGGQAA